MSNNFWHIFKSIFKSELSILKDFYSSVYIKKMKVIKHAQWLNFTTHKWNTIRVKIDCATMLWFFIRSDCHILNIVVNCQEKSCYYFSKLGMGYKSSKTFIFRENIQLCTYLVFLLDDKYFSEFKECRRKFIYFVALMKSFLFHQKSICRYKFVWNIMKF